jgi:hypothetical protein
MRAKPMTDIWSRSSGYVRLRLHAGRFWAAGQCAEECEGQDLVLLSAFLLRFCEDGPMQDTHQFSTEATRQNVNSSTLVIRDVQRSTRRYLPTYISSL